MEGKKVHIQLNTPIVIHVSRDANLPQEPETITSIVGTLVKIEDSGLIVTTSEVYNNKARNFIPKHSEFFLPHHKVDHALVIG